MIIRRYTESDLNSLRRMHSAQGFDYPFPNIDDSIFLSKLVSEDEKGRATMASLARLTCEVYLLVDPAAGKPRDRFNNLVALNAAGERDLQERGLDDAEYVKLAHRVMTLCGRIVLTAVAREIPNANALVDTFYPTLPAS